jgi:DNA helicase HerA-like ATPase
MTNPIFDKRRRVGLVIGKTGSGKSYYVKKAVEKMLRVVVLDFVGEYHPPDFDGSGFNYFQNWQTFADDLYQRRDALICRSVCQFSQNIQDYSDALEACYAIGNLVVIIEEIHQFGNFAGMSESLEKATRLGRHRSVSLIGVSQRFFDVHNAVRVNLDVLVAFQLDNPRDIDYLRQVYFIGEKADVLPRLREYEYAAFDSIS